MALGLAVLVAVSAGAPNLTARFAHALLAGTALLTACLLVVLFVLVPAHRAATRSVAHGPVVPSA